MVNRRRGRTVKKINAQSEKKPAKIIKRLEKYSTSHRPSSSKKKNSVNLPKITMFYFNSTSNSATCSFVYISFTKNCNDGLTAILYHCRTIVQYSRCESLKTHLAGERHSTTTTLTTTKTKKKNTTMIC